MNLTDSVVKGEHAAVNLKNLHRVISELRVSGRVEPFEEQTAEAEPEAFNTNRTIS